MTENEANPRPLARPLAPALYLVATPIGNARDIGLRALDILSGANVIACEDTRVTGKLLSLHDITTPMMQYHDHNAERAGPKIIERLKNGESVALVSDAGMPLISAPGYKLIRSAIEGELPVTAAPGANAGLTGLILSGLPTDRYLFQGYLPPKSAQRKKTLAELAPVPATLIFHESAKRLAKSLADMADVLGDRPAAVARELTKLYEQVRRGNLGELVKTYESEGPPKGEVVVIVGPPGESPKPEGEELDQMILAQLDTLGVKDAAKAVQEQTGLPRRDIYARAQELKDKLKHD
jgi:16S rRNA (cytidine1402-2'-O)-methyltransferase